MITKDDCIKVGEVVRTHNLDGDVVITSENDLLEKYAEEPVFILLDGAPVPFFIAEDGVAYRNHSSYFVKFDYVDSVEQAERLLGCDVLLLREVLEHEEIEAIDYDIYALAGLEVRDLVSGKTGKITEVADYAGNVVLSLSIFGKEVLLPFSDNHVSHVDFEQGFVEVSIPEDLIDLN